MRLRFCFILFNYLLAAQGIICLIFGEVIPAPVGWSLLGFLILFLFLELQKKLPIQPAQSFSIWKIGVIAFPLIYLTVQPELVNFLVWILLSLLMTRFIFKTEFNDYLYSFLISIVCLLMGALFIHDLVFGALFVSFYLTLCWGLMFYNMMVERVGSHCPPDQFRSAGERERAGFSLFGLSASLVVVSMALTAAIFMAFPRLSLGFLDVKVSGPPMSGFTDKVALGDVGRIKQNSSVVMRVEFRNQGQPYRPLSTVFWRGVALDFYDGETWTSTMPVVRRWRNWAGNGIRLFDTRSLRNVIEQNIFMESFNSPVLLTTGRPVFIEGSFQNLQLDQGYSLSTFDGYSGTRRFKMFSDMGQPSITHPNALPKPSRHIFPERFLQTPEVSEEMTTLARSLGKDITNTGDKAEAILSFLRKKFSYTLDMKRMHPEKSAMDEFLFDRKTGHCEYFASAMALLLRLNKVPSRIVNGFMSREWNELGNYMIVRQAHAHSWVEAYVPGQGWTRYDPTPPAPISAETRETTFSRGIDLLRLHWQRYVVKYSLKDQFHLFQFFNRETRELTQQLKSIKSLTHEDFMDFFKSRSFLTIVFLALAVLLWKWHKAGGWHWTPSQPTPFAVGIYKQMLNRLEKLGYPKQDSATHIEYLDDLGALPEEKSRVVLEITRIYEMCRFGNHALGPGDKQHLKQLIRQL